MRSRSRPEWEAPTGDAEPVLPAVSTSSLAFQAILDDLVRTVGDIEAAPVPPDPPLTEPPLPDPSLAQPSLASAETRGPDSPSEFSPHGELGPLDGLAGEAQGQGQAAAQPQAPAPGLLRGRGDLTLVVGLGADAIAAARMLGEAIGDAEVRPGGCSRAAAPRVDDRRGALRARADGVRRERPIVAGFGFVRGAAEVPELAESLAGIEPDQVWVTVDVSRKSEDTAAWVRAVDAVLAVDGVIVTGTDLTASPDSANELGLPIGWLDGTRVGIG